MNRILIFFCLINRLIFSQSINETEIIGKWQFIELQDDKGVKHSKIPLSNWGGNHVENVNRDSYFFKTDGNYESTNPLNFDTGTWFFDADSHTINLELRVSPNDKILPDLKRVNIVQKREDGFYYQKPVKKRILFFSKDSMVIADRDRYRLIYLRER